MMIKSIDDIPVLRTFLGSSISWVRLLLSINSSDANPSRSSTFPCHHCLDLQLKSPVCNVVCNFLYDL